MTSESARSAPKVQRIAKDDDDRAPVRGYRVRTTLTLEEDGRSRITREERYELLNSAPPLYYSEVEVTFDPTFDERPEVYAEVHLLDGSVRTLDPATVIEAPLEGWSPGSYSDQRRLVAPIPSLQKGVSVLRRTTRIKRRPLGDFGTSWALPMSRSLAADEIAVTIEHPRTLAPVVLPVGVEVTPVREESGERVRLSFTIANAPAVVFSSSLPPESRQYPEILVSTARSWRAVARGYLALVRPAFDSAPLGALAAELEPASAAPRDVAAAALDWMHHNLRYTGLDLANGGVIPRSAGETLQRGYGDCKDLAAFLVALLDAAGVEARIALLSTRFWADAPDEVPGLGSFDHAIVYVPGAEPLWIDPTMRGYSPGVLSDLTVDRMALIIDEETKGRVRTPRGGPERNRVAIHTEVTLPKIGAGTIRTVRTLHGTALDWGRDRAIWQTPGQLQAAVAAEVESSDGAEDFDYFHSDPLSAIEPFEEVLEIRGATSARATDVSAIAPWGFDELLGLLPEGLDSDPGEDAEDVFIGAPAEIEVVTRVHAHPMYKLRGGTSERGGEAGGDPLVHPDRCAS